MQQFREEDKIRIACVGFGTFGQFLCRRLVQAGHTVLAHSRSDYSKTARQMGVQYFQSADDLCEEHPDVVILASSILSTETVLHSLPLQRLRRSTLFVDVLSVKHYPKRLLLAHLPAEADILCTHPMFGPDSGRGSWDGLNFMYERVRIADDPACQARAQAFIDFFAREGCRMTEMSCEEHDRLAAGSQFITHTVGRVLGAMELQATQIDTDGFKSLLNLVKNTNHDSFDLYYGLFLYNQNATEELERLEQAFAQVKRQLFGQLHTAVRPQRFRGSGSVGAAHPVNASTGSAPQHPAPAAVPGAAGRTPAEAAQAKVPHALLAPGTGAAWEAPRTKSVHRDVAEALDRMDHKVGNRPGSSNDAASAEDEARQYVDGGEVWRGGLPLGAQREVLEAGNPRPGDEGWSGQGMVGQVVGEGSELGPESDADAEACDMRNDVEANAAAASI